MGGGRRCCAQLRRGNRVWLPQLAADAEQGGPVSDPADSACGDHLWCPDDAMADYLADKPGWLCSQIDSPALGERLRDHLSRRWSAAQLAPAHREAWPRVGDAVGIGR